MVTAGSKLVLPMVVLNMGGEMVYILHQRLNAQRVDADKKSAVLRDVICTMFAPQFVEELFKPQDMYSEKATKEIFFKLAHSSIMRLNESSMNKLFDLITMGLKYQALSCAQPQQLLQVTLNHLETLKIMVPSHAAQIDTVIETTIAAYRHLDTFGWMQLKQRLLEAFQGRRVKISLFLQYKVQLSNGTLVLAAAGKLPVGVETPGVIRYFGSGGKDDITVVLLPMASAEIINGSSETYIDFDSPMGTNIYEASPNSALDPRAVGLRTPATEAAAAAVAEAATRKPKKTAGRDRRESKEEERASVATAGLNLLAALLGAPAREGGADGGDDGAGGAKRRGPPRDSFKINLFPDDAFDAAQAKSVDDDDDEGDTVTINLATSHAGCAKMLQELDLDDSIDHHDNDGSGGGGCRGGKGVDPRGDGGAGGTRVGAKGGEDEVDDNEDNDLDDLLDLMDSAAESK